MIKFNVQGLPLIVINTLIGKKLLVMIIVGQLLKGVYQTHLCSWYFPFPYFQSIPLQASGEFSQASRHSCSLSTDGSGFPPITWLVSNTCHPSMHSPPILKNSKNLMTSSKGNIFRVTDPLCGEFIGYRWIPLTKASGADLRNFLWSDPEQTVQQTIETPVIWDAIALIITSL